MPRSAISLFNPRSFLMPDQINVALVGLGFGAEFIPIYQKHLNARIVAICQRNEASLNKIGGEFGICLLYTSPSPRD